MTTLVRKPTLIPVVWRDILFFAVIVNLGMPITLVGILYVCPGCDSLHSLAATGEEG